jgi:protein gp37
MDKTKIEWTDTTWNPIRGCSRISEGCRNCYAEKMAARFNKPGQPYEGLARMTRKGARWTGEVKLLRDKLEDPLRWTRPRRVFVNSMSDLFHEKVPYDFIRDVFCVMGMARRHTFQVLTKRVLEMEQWFSSTEAQATREYCLSAGAEWPLKNVWIGASVEDQKAADERIPFLLTIPAAVLFVSCEPLIGPVDLSLVTCPMMRAGLPPNTKDCPICHGEDHVGKCVNGYFNAFEEGIAWVIVGCETGPSSQVRDMKTDWVRSLRTQCAGHGAAFFYKQAKDEQGKTIKMPCLDGYQHREWPG